MLVNSRSVPAAILTPLLLLVVACDHRTEQQSTDTGASGRSSVAASTTGETVVHVYNWFDYIDPAMLEKFTAETAIRVVYDVYDANEVLETKLLAGNTGYDVVVPSLTFLERQIRAGVFRKLDRSQIPNWTNLDPEILRQVSLIDPGNAHAVPYMWGTNGIGYNEGKVKAIMPDAPVDSWRLVFEPAIVSRFKDCGIGVLDSPSDIVPLVLIYLGKDANSESKEDLRLAEETLMAIRPYVRMIHSSALTDALANGDLCLTVNWNGPVALARARAADAGMDDVITYSIPKEGTVGWYDSMAIPTDAPHAQNAHAFINFMQRPDVAAANSNFINYANGNVASYPLINEGIRSDSGVYPSAEVKARLTVDLSDSEQFSRSLNRTWSRFVAGK
jgi:putrescine transport system substrate-binding protein